MSDAESKSESAATAAPPEGDAAATAQEAPTESPKAEDDSAPEEPKAEEAPAEEPKAEEAPAEEPKAEEPKAEEAPAEEPKAEEAPAEEPKAEATPAPAPKAEEPKAKAEDPKVEASTEAPKGGHKKGKKPPKPAKPEVPAPAPKKEKEPAPEAKKGARIGEEEEKSAQDLLFDNLPLVIVVCVIFSLIPVAWTYYGQVSAEDSQQAWTDYGDARKKTLAEAEYERLVGEHAETTAAPYLKISWAAKLYESGEKAKVERARDLLKEVKRDYSHLDLVAELVEPQIKKIEAELASPRAHWAPATSTGKAGTAPTSSN